MSKPHGLKGRNSAGSLFPQAEKYLSPRQLRIIFHLVGQRTWLDYTPRGLGFNIIAPLGGPVWPLTSKISVLSWSHRTSPTWSSVPRWSQNIEQADLLSFFFSEQGITRDIDGSKQCCNSTRWKTCCVMPCSFAILSLLNCQPLPSN